MGHVLFMRVSSNFDPVFWLIPARFRVHPLYMIGRAAEAVRIFLPPLFSLPVFPEGYSIIEILRAAG